MIVAREKTSSYGIFDETFQQKRNSGRKSIMNADKLALTLFVFTIFGVGIVVIAYFAQMSTLGYKIDRFNKELAALRVENNALEGQVQQILALDSVEYAAVSELDMVKPEASDYMLLTVNDAGVDSVTDETAETAETAENQEILSPENEKGAFLSVFGRYIKYFIDRYERLQ